MCESTDHKDKTLNTENKTGMVRAWISSLQVGFTVYIYNSVEHGVHARVNESTSIKFSSLGGQNLIPDSYLPKVPATFGGPHCSALIVPPRTHHTIRDELYGGKSVSI